MEHFATPLARLRSAAAKACLSLAGAMSVISVISVASAALLASSAAVGCSSERSQDVSCAEAACTQGAAGAPTTVPDASSADAGSQPPSRVEPGMQTPPTNDGASATSSEGCDDTTPEIRDVSPQELEAMLSSKDFTLINVHIPFAGEIPGTDVHIAYTDIDALEAQLQQDRAAKAILYCRSGAMSLSAATKLTELGYCQIYDMPGGMNAWTAAGYTLDN